MHILIFFTLQWDHSAMPIYAFEPDQNYNNINHWTAGCCSHTYRQDRLWKLLTNYTLNIIGTRPPYWLGPGWWSASISSGDSTQNKDGQLYANTGIKSALTTDQFKIRKCSSQAAAKRIRHNKLTTAVTLTTNEQKREAKFSANFAVDSSPTEQLKYGETSKLQWQCLQTHTTSNRQQISLPVEPCISQESSKSSDIDISGVLLRIPRSTGKRLQRSRKPWNCQKCSI